MTYCENAIEMKEISKSYGDFALKSVNLTVPKGSIVGLVGRNGAGKSTLIRLLTGGASLLPKDIFSE